MTDLERYARDVSDHGSAWDQQAAREAVVAERIGQRRYLAPHIVKLDLAIDLYRQARNDPADFDQEPADDLAEIAHELIVAWRDLWTND